MKKKCTAVLLKTETENLNVLSTLLQGNTVKYNTYMRSNWLNIDEYRNCDYEYDYPGNAKYDMDTTICPYLKENL